MAFSTEEQKGHWPPGILSGGQIGAYSLSEPQAGSEFGASQCGKAGGHRRGDGGHRQGEVDVGVQVCLKMCGQFGREVGDLAVEPDDDAHRRAGRRGERGGDRRGSGELFGAVRSAAAIS